MNWSHENHHDHSSQHSQKADKNRLAQLALQDADTTVSDPLRRREMKAA